MLKTKLEHWQMELVNNTMQLLYNSSLPFTPQVDIVCGTPGRLDDMISTGKLDLSNVS